MGRKKERLAAFLLEHPLCFVCGADSQEEDHVPSRACFDGRIWPEGFVFPVCRTCNADTAQDEQFVALFSRVWSSPAHEPDLAEVRKYMTGVNNNNPDLFKKMLVREIEVGPEHTTVEVGPEVRDCMNRVIPKWARAFHYMETKQILPENVRIYGRYFTWFDLQEGIVPQQLFFLPPRRISRNNKDLSGQFGLMCADPSPEGVCLYVALFRRAFGVWMIVDPAGHIPLDEEARFTLLNGD